MIITNTNPSTTNTKRRNNYEARVAAWIAKNGPEFELVSITYSDTPVRCEACGKPDIHNEYWVKSTTTGSIFRVGCECQELVLPLVEAHIPASRVRKLDLCSLTKLGAKYGLDIQVNHTPTAEELADLADEVITARRCFANRAGWCSRVEQGKVKAKVEAPAQLAE